ncbi:hypothetical protein GGX14DRAFT_476715, partial [Mycena pura]
MHVLLQVRVLLLVRRRLGLGLRLRLQVGVVCRRGIEKTCLRRLRRRAHRLRIHLRSRGLRRLLVLLDGHGDARWETAALAVLGGILLVGRQRGRWLLLLLLGGRPGPLVHMANKVLHLFGGWARLGAILEVEILEAWKTEVLWWREVAVAGSRGHRPEDEHEALALVDG